MLKSRWTRWGVVPGLAVGGFLGVVAVEPTRRRSVYRRVPLLASGSALPAGCFNWSRAW